MLVSKPLHLYLGDFLQALLEMKTTVDKLKASVANRSFTQEDVDRANGAIAVVKRLAAGSQKMLKLLEMAKNVVNGATARLVMTAHMAQ